MSRVYFHSFDDEAIVRGSERAHMSIVISDIMMAAIGNPRYAKEWLQPLFPPGHYMRDIADEYRFEQSAKSALSAGWKPLVLPSGKKVDLFTLALNTALVMGGDTVKLFARLHGQCEIHCWIEGRKDKQFIADLIKKGREQGLMRENEGWEDVVALLEKPDDSAVVCSYSVCEQFPNWGMLPDDHDLKVKYREAKEKNDGDADCDECYKISDQFYDMSHEDQWEECMKTLRASADGLRITKKGWEKFFYGDGTTALNLRARAKASEPVKEIAE